MICFYCIPSALHRVGNQYTTVKGMEEMMKAHNGHHQEVYK